MPLTADRWRTLSPYLDEALEIPTRDRGAWLESIFARDPAIARDLQKLLAERDLLHESSFLEGAAPLSPELSARSLEGQTVGAYRLVSQIGQGGMGGVWLAERCDGRFEGRAAVKLLNVALIGRAGEERFRREGTILARLAHPNIARLIDAGITHDAQPFLILEYVDGTHIDRYCDEHALSVEGRLRLFLDVLDAIVHAHANLIVHRDIKPPNVLVARDGTIKLLDFGIAKLLHDERGWDPAGNAGGLTREAGTALTPQYAAPEQVSGGSITTATDVYALGVLLYLLLTGQHPAGAALQSPATLMHAIVETEPRRVSDTVVGPGSSRDEVLQHASRCGTTPAKLRRVLRGDLDTIVAKALKKNPAERYVSATAFADDLRRYFRQEPIAARPETVRYRATKFIRRHAQGVAAAAVVAVLLGGSTAFYTTRLAQERDRAQREAAKATRVSELMVGLLSGADPMTNRATPDGPTVRALLDSGADQARRELVDQPEVQADILTVLGRTYRRLGVFDRAEVLLEQALVAAQKAYGPEDVHVAQTLNDLGVLLTDRGDYEGAARHLEQSLTIRRKLLGEAHPDVAVTLVELGRVYQDLGFNQSADPLLRESLDIRRRVLGDDDRETAVSLNGVASVLRLNGDLAGAETMLRQSLELNRKTRGEYHPNTGTSLHDLGLVTASRGDYRAAEALFREALTIHRRALGESHPIVAMTLNSLSRVLVEQGRYTEAVDALEHALAIARPALGPDHQLVGIYTLNLASVQLTRKNPAAAESLAREGLRIRSLAPGLVPNRRRTFVEDDWTVGGARSMVGASLLALGRLPEAEAALLDAMRDLKAMPAPPRRDVTDTVARLIQLYDAWGLPARAATYRAALMR
jgi:serine/threonine protein kinase/tetratricopeptide (TPR) repeat protein